MIRKLICYFIISFCSVALFPVNTWSNPWNGRVVLQAFWWDCWNENYPQDWYTYLSKLSPRLRELGFDSIWIPSPAKGNAGTNSMGYDIFDHYDLGDKDQKGTVATRFGDKDSLLRLIAVAHANGLAVYPDICYLDTAHGGGGNGRYMRDRGREWLVWLTKQLDADGFRFDAVKHYPAYVVEDLLFNALGKRIDYFAVGEYVGTRQQLDSWAAETRNRGGTFDFALREALAEIVAAGGFFDMGSLPNFQQKNRTRTVPFVNNHDTWRGSYWDSEPGSNAHDDRFDDWRRNSGELAPTIDPENPRADVAYAAAFAVDGSPMVYYEDLFVNHGTARFKADPAAHPTRDYLVNLVWCHQKLQFKEGAYKVRYQGSPDLLVIERSGKAIIGLNDHGSEWLSVRVQTDFGPRVKLHDYSGAVTNDAETDENGQLEIAVPPMGYCVWGPAGVSGGFAPAPRRTVQEFELDDDLGDSRSPAPGYGGKVQTNEYRTAGSVWAAARSIMKVRVFTAEDRSLELRVAKPGLSGQKSDIEGYYKAGHASRDTPLYFEFETDREGYHQLSAKIVAAGQLPASAFIEVDYEAPAVSGKF